MKTIAGLFETKEQADQAVAALQQAGFRVDDIGVVMRDAYDPNAEDIAEGRSEGAGLGAVGGGVLGALGGLLVGASALVVPGIGPALAAGAIASTVIGGALGAAAGGLVGALIDAGLTEEDARHYQAGVARGGVLVTVLIPDRREAELRAIFRANGLQDLEYHRNLWEVDPSHRYDLPPTTALDARPGAQWKAAERQGAVLAGGSTGVVIGGAIGVLTAGPVGAMAGVALGAFLAGGAAGAALDYHEVEPHFQDDWRHGTHYDRFAWDEASAAYRYGWDSYAEPEFRGRLWRDVRHDLERRWPGGAAWCDVEPLVRAAWDRRTHGEAS